MIRLICYRGRVTEFLDGGGGLKTPGYAPTMKVNSRKQLQYKGWLKTFIDSVKVGSKLVDLQQ